MFDILGWPIRADNQSSNILLSNQTNIQHESSIDDEYIDGYL